MGGHSVTCGNSARSWRLPSLRRWNDITRRRAGKPRHRACRDNRVLLRISLVVLLDVLEIVKVIHHQSVRLLQRPLRRIGQEVESFEARAVAEMEARDRIERRAAGPARRPM